MNRYSIFSNSSIIDCMIKMDRSAAGIALAVDDEFKLVGTISDGDIRRALINGADLNSSIKPFINRECFAVSPAESRTEVLDIMQARRFEQVPVVDEDGIVVGLHLLHDLLGTLDRPNWAVIMAGGKGTRLRPLTEKIPKPMLKVAGRPILERIILNFVSYGIKRLFLAVNYLAHMIEDYFEDGARYGCRIEYLHEDEPLGSGGALSLLPQPPECPLFLMNGDLITDVNFSKMLNFHTKHQYYATMGVHTYAHEVPFGCVETQDDLIIGLQEKPILEKIINAGIYVFSPDAVKSIPDNSFFPITNVFEMAIRKKLNCGAFVIEKEWIDVGQPRHLKEARGDM